MNALVRGLIAGAGGTIALDMTTYSDMALTGRGASSSPSEVVRKLSALFGLPGLAMSDQLASDQIKNRRSAIGAILGMKVGLGIGVIASILHPLLRPMPMFLQAAVIGGAAMAAADVPLAQLGVSDPKTWSKTDWLRDVIPHYVYGLTTALVISELAETEG